MSTHPKDEADDRPIPPAERPEVPLEVLEDDEDVPPRPEEAVADAPAV